MPALLTSTSIPPKRSMTAFIAFATAASSVTSQVRVSAAACAAPSGFRSSDLTVKPSSRSRPQVASPMPEAPPVTTATWLAVTGSPSQVHQVDLARAQPRELDEVLGVEEELVQLGHVVDRPALGPPDQVVDVLERVLGAVADVVGTQDLARVRVDDQLEPAGQDRPGERIQHRSLGGRQRERLGVGVVRWHLDLDDVAVLRPGFRLG